MRQGQVDCRLLKYLCSEAFAGSLWFRGSAVGRIMRACGACEMLRTHDYEAVTPAAVEQV